MPEHLIEQKVGLCRNGLQSSCSINVYGGRDSTSPVSGHVEDVKHVRRWRVAAEDRLRCLKQHGRSVRAKWFSLFNNVVQSSSDILTPRVRKNAPIAERTRTEF